MLMSLFGNQVIIFSRRLGRAIFYCRDGCPFVWWGLQAGLFRSVVLWPELCGPPENIVGGWKNPGGQAKLYQLEIGTEGKGMTSG